MPRSDNTVKLTVGLLLMIKYATAIKWKPLKQFNSFCQFKFVQKVLKRKFCTTRH